MAETRKFHPNGDSYCSACKAIRYERFRKQSPERVSVYTRNSHLRKIYGLEPEAYQDLLKAQDDGCAICGTTEWGKRRPHVDHDHATGHVRGILCHRCNTALGLLRENPVLLRKAISYLSKAGKGRKKK